MGVHNMTLEDLKKQRPDLYQAIKLEVCLGELRLTKDDIISLIDPLSENIKNHLKPYLPKLRSMTYNDIVDMENDIVDEISEQLLNEFEELEQIVNMFLVDSSLDHGIVTLESADVMIKYSIGETEIVLVALVGEAV